MNHRPLHEVVRERRLVCDGAMGTQLMLAGLEQGSCGEAWNLTHPEIVREITREYREAGAEIILTNTFGASRLRLEAHGLADRAREINVRGAELAREVVARDAVVAGDIGPTGRMLTLGEVSRDELAAAFTEQARALRDGGVDWIVVESMIDAEEMGRLSLG